MKTGTVLGLTIVAILIAIGFVLVRGRGGIPVSTPLTPGTTPIGVSEGSRASDFRLKNFDGQEQSLQELTVGKKVTVMNFYASWCPPCKEEIPYFIDIYNEKKGEGVQFIGINTQDDQQSGRDFTLVYQIAYPTLFDKNSRIFFQYRAFMPSTIILNKDGVIVKRFTGAVAEDALRAFIDQTLRES